MSDGPAEFDNPDSPIRPDVDVPSIPGQTVESIMKGSGYAPSQNNAGKDQPQNTPDRNFSDALPLKKTGLGDIVSKLLRRRPLT